MGCVIRLCTAEMQQPLRASDGLKIIKKKKKRPLRGSDGIEAIEPGHIASLRPAPANIECPRVGALEGDVRDRVVLGIGVRVRLQMWVSRQKRLGCNLEDVVVASASDARMRPVGDGVIRHIQPHTGEANARLVCPPHLSRFQDFKISRFQDCKRGIN